MGKVGNAHVTHTAFHQGTNWIPHPHRLSHSRKGEAYGSDRIIHSSPPRSAILEVSVDLGQSPKAKSPARIWGIRKDEACRNDYNCCHRQTFLPPYRENVQSNIPQ